MSLASKSWSLLKRDWFLFATNLVTSVVVARMLGPAGLGLSVILQLIPSYAEAFGRIKVDVAAVYFLGQSRYSVADVVVTLNVIALSTGIAISLPLAVGADWFTAALFTTHASEVRAYIYPMLLQVPLSFLYMNYVYLFIHREDVRSYNAMVVVRALTSSGGTILLLTVFDLGIAAVVFGSTLAVFFAMVFGVLKFGRPSPMEGRFNPMVMKHLVGYGFKLYLAGVVSYLNSYVSQAIVIAFCSPAQVAFFTIAQNQAPLIAKVTDAMGIVLYPRISKSGDMVASSDIAAKAFRVALIILCATGIAAAVLIRPLLLLVYGASYEPAIWPFYIMIPGFVLSAAANTLIQFFQGVGRADLVTKIALVPLGVQVVLGLLLIPHLGIIGAAICLLLGSAATAASQIWVFLNVSQARLGSLVPGRPDFALVSNFVAGMLRGHRRRIVR